MAYLNSMHGYMATYQTNLSFDEREKSLEEDYYKNLNAHAKNKRKSTQTNCRPVDSLHSSLAVLERNGFGLSDFFLMNIAAFNYGAYADYQLIEKSHYLSAKGHLKAEQ